MTAALRFLVPALAVAWPHVVAADEPPVQEITPEEPPPTTAPPPAPPVPAPSPEPAATPKHVRTLEEITIPRSYLRFGINFFGDAAAFVATPQTPHTGFAIGALAIRMIGELGPTLDALAEVAMETKDAGPKAEVEQLVLRWHAGPGVLEFGRFHTDLGFWNTAYHHGLWLQTPIDRPHAIRFEDDGGLLPVHSVGLEYALTGALGGGTGRLVAGVGNGRGRIVDDVRVAGDTNEAKAVHVKLRYKAGSLELGAGALYDVIAPEPIAVRPALPDTAITELIGSAYVVLHADGPLLIAEGHVLHHRANGSITTTYAGFGLLGFAVSEWLRPYVALDVISGADDDPFFVPDPATPIAIDLVEGIAGVRFETSTWSALKLELQYTTRAATTDDDIRGVVNWSFGL